MSARHELFYHTEATLRLVDHELSEHHAVHATHAAPDVSGWKTSCTMPERSRRSMKIRPPWSRRRCTQPATRAALPARSAVSSPAQASR